MSREKVRVKICGLTRAQDAKLAASLGAWALGFIFYEKSPRAVTADTVKLIMKPLKLSSAKFVGVFVNPSLEEIKKVMAIAPLHFIQLHGEENDEFCKEVKAAFPKTGLIKAVRIGDALDRYCDYLLVDSVSQGQYGGTGVTVDWKAAAEMKNKPLILAGGLNAENIKMAIDEVNPFAVDVSSGVEELPGVKSEFKLRAFFKAIQSEN